MKVILLHLLLSSPAYYSARYVTMRTINNDLTYYNDIVYRANGVRPVIALNRRAIISSGTGSETNPYVIE